MQIRRSLLMQSRPSGPTPPTGYKFIEYAESDGSARVDIPIGFEPTDEIELYGALLQITSDKFVVSTKTWNNNKNRFGLLGAYSTNFNVAFGSVSTATTKFNVRANMDFHTVSYKNHLFTLDDAQNTVDVSGISFGGTTTDIVLFYGYNSITKSRIGYYRHKKSGGTEYNIVPIQSLMDGTVEMYDTISGIIMTRTGTLSAPST